MKPINLKKYKLLNENNEIYLSDVPGTLGGNRRSKVYGKFNCPIAKRYLKKGTYQKNRVFFASEEIALKAGYRPCKTCMKK